MRQYVMIELTEETAILGTIQDFEWDNAFGSIKTNESRFLYRGCLLSNEAKNAIENLSCFDSLWQDGGIGPAVIDFNPDDFIGGEVTETSEKGEFELLLLFAQRKGKNTSFYQKWLDKMEDGKFLAKPVFGKMVGEFGTSYAFEKDEEVMKIYDSIKKIKQ